MAVLLFINDSVTFIELIEPLNENNNILSFLQNCKADKGTYVTRPLKTLKTLTMF